MPARVPTDVPRLDAAAAPQPMHLDALLADPALGLTLVAGHAGVAARGPIRWATISDLPDPTPWLEGGELLLTTGLGFAGDLTSAPRRLVAALDDRGCTAVGFGIGVVHDRVPEAMLAAADERRLPLFTVPYEVPFIAVTKRVTSHIFADHYATLRAAVDLHRAVLAGVLAGTGISGVLDTVLRRIEGAAAVVFDYYGHVLAARGRRDAREPTAVAALWAELQQHRRDREPFTLARGPDVATGAWLRVGEAVEAAVVLLTPRPLHDHEALLFEQGMAGLTLELARGLSVRQAHRARIGELLDEVVAGRLSSEALRRRLTRLAVAPDAPYAVLCAADERTSVATLCGILEDVLPGAAVGEYDGRACAVVQPPGDQAEQVLAAARARGLTELRIGWSGRVEGPDRLGPAVAEAAAAAVAPGPGGIRDIGSLGLAGLLAGVARNDVAAAFVRHVLGPVIDHDAREGTALVRTLAAYLRHGCRPGPAAAELCVHRHTLAYRLERIADLTGRDPRNGRHLLEFGVALELAQPPPATPSTAPPPPPVRTRPAPTGEVGPPPAEVR